MHRYGGMYADLDVEALRDLIPLLGNETRPVFSAMQVVLPPPRSLERCPSCARAHDDLSNRVVTTTALTVEAGFGHRFRSIACSSCVLTHMLCSCCVRLCKRLGEIRLTPTTIMKPC